MAWWTLRKFADRLPTPYVFCRRDVQQRPRAIGVDTFLRTAFAAVAAALLFVVALAQSDRLFEPSAPEGPFALTIALGLLATVSVTILLARVGAQFTTLLGSGTPPELPLTPTIWIKSGHGTDRRWIQIAEAKGWRVVESQEAPVTGFDLVVGDPSSPRRLDPDTGASRDDISFQLDRRLAVVMRRRFWRGMKRLFKSLRAAPRTEGSGFLFCPHVWLVKGVVRDVDPKDQAAAGSLIGPAYVGPLFDDVFPRRVRRYLGGVLRDLGVDIVYWEDAIRWPDLKRVFGVAFEIHDQHRSPLQERHFVGVPGVRVMLQVDHAETEPPPSGDYPTPAPGHMRVMIVLRDRGGEEAPVAPAPPGGRKRRPVPV
jgi:hypothetical protein